VMGGVAVERLGRVEPGVDGGRQVLRGVLVAGLALLLALLAGVADNAVGVVVLTHAKLFDLGKAAPHIRRNRLRNRCWGAG
jgi:hypothetical protein